MPAALQHISTCGHSPVLQDSHLQSRQAMQNTKVFPACPLKPNLHVLDMLKPEKSRRSCFIYLFKDIKLSSVLPVSLLGIQNIVIAGCSATSLNRKWPTRMFKQEALLHLCYGLQELLMRLTALQSPVSANFKLLPVSLLCCPLWETLINRKKPLTQSHILLQSFQLQGDNSYRNRKLQQGVS